MKVRNTRSAKFAVLFILEPKIRLYKNIKLSAVFGVSNQDWRKSHSFSISVTIRSIFMPGFWMSFSTLSGLKGRSPVLNQPEMIFRELNTLYRARLQKRVKYCFPIMLELLRYKRLTSSRYAIFSSPKIPTLQG